MMKKEENFREFLGYIGLIVMIIGLVLAIFFANTYWYSFFVIGGTLFLAYVNKKIKNKSLFNVLAKDKIKFFYIWISYIFLSVIIEIVGRFILDFWYYPTYNFFDEIINVYLIGYPFALFMTYETFILIYSKVKNFLVTFVGTTIISGFIHEIPNTFAYEWVYTIRYEIFEILNINVVVIFGWFILVLLAFIIQNKVFK